MHSQTGSQRGPGVSLDRFSLIINSAREIVPPAAHLEESLMHPPAIANRLLMGLPRTRIRLPELQRLNGIAENGCAAL